MNPEDSAGHIIWPEDRWVTVKEVEGWFEDAVANGDVIREEWGPHVQEKFEALDSAGLLTRGRAT